MFNIKITGIESAIERINGYKVFVVARTQRVAEKLMEAGYDVASIGFSKALYAGTNDVVVDSPVWKGETLVLRANGNAVAFIEFGSGKFYEDYPNQEAYSKLGMSQRGEFGKKKGAHPPWRYIGDAGNLGVVLKHKSNGTDVVQTYGNRPARAMYDATITVADKEKALEIAKEVFK